MAKSGKHQSIKNPVAKYMPLFNRPKVFKDKTKYSRKNAVKGQEPYALCCFPA